MTPNLPPCHITGYRLRESLWPAGRANSTASPRTQRDYRLDNRRAAASVSRTALSCPPAVVPGLKTRRLDRLSAWALVASSLAIKDAGIDLNQVDRSRVAVVFATAFGCVELTEAFYLSAAANGWNGTDPSTFPETLPSAPASHVSLFHGLRGPNITVSNKHFAGESAHDSSRFPASPRSG